MGVDYIPERDLRAAAWMKNFARQLVANPDAYRTTAADAAQVQAMVLAFRMANAKANSAARCKNLVLVKNDARTAAEMIVRSQAQRIRTDPQITAAAKATIGLKLTGKRRRHVGPPDSVPVLGLTLLDSEMVTVMVLDSQSFKKGRPVEAIGYELYERIAPFLMTDASSQAWQFMGTYTSTPITFVPSVQQAGDQVWLKARWVTRRGEVGAFGDAKGIYVPGVAMQLGSMQQMRRRQAA